MRKLISMMVLAAVTSSAVAEWVEKGRTEDFVIYVDTADIQGNGNRVKMWSLIDYSGMQTSDSGQRYRSIKTQDEYYCNSGQTRLLYISQHSGNMGHGREVFSFAFSNAERRSRTDSNNEGIWKTACGNQ